MNAKKWIQTADKKGRIAFPGFAEATVIIEQIDEMEFRVCKAVVIAEKDLQFHEEAFPRKLSEADATMVLVALEDPPPPNEAARKAAMRFLSEF